jgi:hypothetical protein
MTKKQKNVLLFSGLALAGLYLYSQKQTVYTTAPSPNKATNSKLNRGLAIAQELANLFKSISTTVKSNQASAGESYSDTSNVAGINIY